MNIDESISKLYRKLHRWNIWHVGAGKDGLPAQLGIDRYRYRYSILIDIDIHSII